MRIVSVGNLTPGQVVGRPIVDAGGKVLLNRDVVLTPEYIRALQAKEFSTIYVKGGENEPDVALDEDIDPAIRARAIKALGDTFKTIEHQLQGLRKQSFDDLTKVCASTSMRALFGKGGPIAEVFSTVNGILDEVLTRSTLAGLTSIKSADSQAYNHSIDVCVVGIMIGRAVGMTDARLKQLAVGCLLHDIGKVFVDRAANEVTQVRQHTLLGYELLKNADDPEIMAPHVALEHHERQDGNGEPRGLVGSNTIERDRALPPPIPTLIGEIGAVANVYDNLMSGSPSRPPMPPDTTLQAIRSAAGTHLNRAVVVAFLRVVPVYPLGTEVLVRSERYRGFSGLVTRVNVARLDKPTILLLHDAQGNTIAPVELNLNTEPDLEIRCKGL